MVSRRVLLVVAVVVLVVLGAGGAVALSLDSDGVPPVREFQDGTDPFDGDTDGDGLSDSYEPDFGSDPLVADTDGDGLTDGEERAGTRFFGGVDESAYSDGVPEWNGSDPTATDTDGDGLTDGAEASAGLDPTATDSDRDGLADPEERAGPTDPASPDTDGDNYRDGWEVAGETDTGAALPGADPLHKDLYVQVTYLRGVDHETPPRVFDRVEAWFADMPVQNPDGETGVAVHFATGDRYSGPIDRSIDEWTKSNGQPTAGVSGFMAMREFYNREVMGPRTGSYHLLVFPGPDVPVRGSGNAGGSKVALVTPWRGAGDDARRKAHTVTHELLHTVVREVGGRDCNGRLHTCEGFLSYSNDYYLSDAAAGVLNTRGFADPVYSDQMNATSCEDTINDPSECGV